MDLEFGPIKLGGRLGRLSRFYKTHQSKIKRYALITLVAAISVIIKLGINNADQVIESATAITLDEATYKPFRMSETIDPAPDMSKTTLRFPLKTSENNQKRQLLNLLQAAEVVHPYLVDAGNICIHARHFAVEYDITFFDNATVVNPEVIAESQYMVTVDEVALDGSSKHTKRPTWIKIRYTSGETLERDVSWTLYGDYAACYAYYNY